MQLYNDDHDNKEARLLRLEQGENLEENQRNLLQITERFFQAIIGSSSEFPPQLRSVCHCLYQVDPTHMLLTHPLCLKHLRAAAACLLQDGAVCTCSVCNTQFSSINAHKTFI